MTRVVINSCYGGFSLSPAAVRRMAEMDGRECYFFRHVWDGAHVDFKRYQQITEEEATGSGFWYAFDIPNPGEVLVATKDWHAMTNEEKNEHNALYARHSLDNREIPRDDPRLIQVVEELGADHRSGASGACANLTIVEVPDDVEWEIQEYDGNEWVAEKHRTWS